MLFGFVFLVLGTVSCFFLPETLERSKRIDEHDDDANCADDNHASSQPISAREKISQMLARISDSVFIFKSPMLFGLSITFLLHSLGAQISEFLFQLASSRFHWTLAEVSQPAYSSTIVYTHIMHVGQLPHSYWIYCKYHLAGTSPSSCLLCTFP